MNGKRFELELYNFYSTLPVYAKRDINIIREAFIKFDDSFFDLNNVERHDKTLALIFARANSELIRFFSEYVRSDKFFMLQVFNLCVSDGNTCRFIEFCENKELLCDKNFFKLYILKTFDAINNKNGYDYEFVKSALKDAFAKVDNIKYQTNKKNRKKVKIKRVHYKMG